MIKMIPVVITTIHFNNANNRSVYNIEVQSYIHLTIAKITIENVIVLMITSNVSASIFMYITKLHSMVEF